MRALSIAATGMLAQQTNVEVIANNLANMNTAGYKRQRAEFQDLLYQNIEQVGEFGALLLETGGVHVRQIIGDHFDVGLLGQHARRGDGKCAHVLGLLNWASSQACRSPGA